MFASSERSQHGHCFHLGSPATHLHAASIRAIMFNYDDQDMLVVLAGVKLRNTVRDSTEL